MKPWFGRIEWLCLAAAAMAGCARYRCPTEIPVEVAGPARAAVAGASGDSVTYTLAQPAVACFPGEWPRARTDRVERAWRDQLYVVAQVAVGPASTDGSRVPVARAVAIAKDGSELAAAEAAVSIPAGAQTGQVRVVLELPEERVKRIATIQVRWVAPGSG